MRFASSFDYVDNAIVTISAIDRHRTAEIVEDVWVELVTLHYRSIEENFEDTCVAGDAISRMPRKVSERIRYDGAIKCLYGLQNVWMMPEYEVRPCFY